MSTAKFEYLPRVSNPLQRPPEPPTTPTPDSPEIVAAEARLREAEGMSLRPVHRDELEEVERLLAAAVESADVDAVTSLHARRVALRLVCASEVAKLSAARAAAVESARAELGRASRARYSTPHVPASLTSEPSEEMRAAAKLLDQLRPRIVEAQAEVEHSDGAPYAVMKLRKLTEERDRLLEVVS